MKILREYDRPYTDHDLPPITRVAQCVTEKANYIVLNTPHGTIDIDLNLGFVLLDYEALDHFGGTRQIRVIPMDGKARDERINPGGAVIAVHQRVSC